MQVFVRMLGTRARRPTDSDLASVIAFFGVNAWICAPQATHRDFESVSARRKVNAWIRARQTADHDPASVIPDKK